MSKGGWIVLVAMGLVAGVLAGVLIASGDGKDDERPVATVTADAPTTGTTGATTGSSPDTTTPADPDDVALGTAERRRVERAALAITGGGTVTEVDRSDDPGESYEVEVLTDQGEIDVALDQDLRRVDNERYDD